MDIQRKKGMLEVCVLAVLKKGSSYGYRIAREVEQCVDISESTLYPILKRLEQNGCLKTYRQEYNGRMRKYYCLTQAGQTKIDGFLDEWSELQQMYRFVAEQNQSVSPAASGDWENTEKAVAEEENIGEAVGTFRSDEVKAYDSGLAKTEPAAAIQDEAEQDKAEQARAGSDEAGQCEAAPVWTEPCGAQTDAAGLDGIKRDGADSDDAEPGEAAKAAENRDSGKPDVAKTDGANIAENEKG